MSDTLGNFWINENGEPSAMTAENEAAAAEIKPEEEKVEEAAEAEKAEETTAEEEKAEETTAEEEKAEETTAEEEKVEETTAEEETAEESAEEEKSEDEEDKEEKKEKKSGVLPWILFVIFFLLSALLGVALFFSIRNSNGDIVELKKENSTLLVQIDEQSETISQLNDTISEQADELAAKDARIAELEAQAASQSDEIAALNDELAAEKADCEERIGELETVIDGSAYQKLELALINDVIAARDARGAQMLLDLIANGTLICSDPDKTVQELDLIVAGNYLVYEVQYGDTLWQICAKYGLDYREYADRVLALNNLPDPNQVYVGQQITLPIAAGSQPVA